MKNVAASILLLIYFVVSSGFVVSIHYCMDEVNGIELGHSDSGDCGQCGMPLEDNDGCCKDEVKVMKMQVDQAVAKIIKADFSLSLLSLEDRDYLFIPVFNTISTAEPVANAPPLDKQDTHLQNCVFRI